MSKPEYEEIAIDLNKHDVEIFSKAAGYVEVKVDGKKFQACAGHCLMHRSLTH